MRELKYLLTYDGHKRQYRLVKSSCARHCKDIIWTFESDKLHIAKKILRNMNLASQQEHYQPSFQAAMA